MKTRYSFGGDEHVFAQCAEDMSLSTWMKVAAIGDAIREADIPGVTEVCAVNNTYMVRFDPDVIPPQEVLERLQFIEQDASKASSPVLETRIVEIPVQYNDPYTNAVAQKFRSRHQDPSASDIEYVARINGYATVDDLIAAHHGSPWIITAIGFVPGTPGLCQLVPRSKQIQAPKYLQPRTETPKLTLGFGGCSSCIYPMAGAGGFQMLGIVAIPIYDPTQRINYLRDEMCLFKPGDIVKFKPLDSDEYGAVQRQIEDNIYTLKVQPVTFSLDTAEADMAAVNAGLMRALDD